MEDLVLCACFSAVIFCEIVLSDKTESHLVGAGLKNLLPPNTLFSISNSWWRSLCLCLSRRAGTHCLTSLSSNNQLRILCVISSGYKAINHNG